MKFVYEYRTSDNVRHEAVISAPNREMAFRLLREQGIRPGVVREAPGFANVFFGRYKRWTAIFALTFTSGALLVGVFSNRRQLEAVERDSNGPLMRRQIYGDPARMDEIARAGYANVFATQADRFLACYAQPARVHRFEHELAKRDARIVAVGKALSSLVSNEWQPAIVICKDDTREVCELKRIVLWMRGELKAYLANGIGTTDSYARRLEQRLNEELSIYNRIKVELQRAKSDAEWEEGNGRLRAIGAPTIRQPDRDDEE